MLAPAVAMAALAANPAAVPAAAYVVMADGGAVARAIAEATCPMLDADGRAITMTVRAAAGTVAQRLTASPAELAKPSAFPLTVCEAAVPIGARQLSIAGRRLPVPAKRKRRIVVIGDTGCRLKAADSAYKACNDPAAFPFARIAASAAAWKPDLVVHVGDYHYRENPCPDGNAGCAGSPWGYGWDAWAADFFGPAAPLLAAAPIAPARGNHENCARAGQGWWRFLDGHAPAAGQDCNDPANDHLGDASTPYAVDLGGGARLILMDLATASNKPLADDDWRRAGFAATYAKVDALSRGARFVFAVNHHPILGLAAVREDGGATLKPGNRAIQSVFGAISPRQAPAGVDVLLAGHVHLWQQVSFAGAFPSQFITGFSGTQEDVVPIPAMLPPDTEAAPGARIAAFSSWVDGFGYMTMERTGGRSWRVLAHDKEGRVVNRCRIKGSKSVCDLPQVRVP